MAEPSAVRYNMDTIETLRDRREVILYKKFHND